LLRHLLQDAAVTLTRGTTYENRPNLAADFFAHIIRQYEGTTLGRQEIDGEFLDDLPGALWSRAIIEATRRRVAPELRRIVVAIDPAATSGVSANETGIIVAGRDHDGHAWVLADLSGRYRPLEWAKTAVAAYHAHRADRVVAEVNHGGEMVEATLQVIDPNLPFAPVRATRGKLTRAEPVAAIYGQGKVHHLGVFPLLEDQMCNFVQGGGEAAGRRAGFSPDRVDALVWALTDLLLAPMASEGIYEVYRQLSSQSPTSQPNDGCISMRKESDR
jgi:phage terminase large subunit-like protein